MTGKGQLFGVSAPDQSARSPDNIACVPRGQGGNETECPKNELVKEADIAIDAYHSMPSERTNNICVCNCNLREARGSMSVSRPVKYVKPPQKCIRESILLTHRVSHRFPLHPAGSHSCIPYRLNSRLQEARIGQGRRVHLDHGVRWTSNHWAVKALVCVAAGCFAVL